MKNITQAEWEAKLSEDKNAIILDVRTADECSYGILENAICLDYFDTEKFLSEIQKADKNKNYYVYCRSGNRSANACRLMEDSGIANTFNLIGGITGWTGKIITK